MGGEGSGGIGRGGKGREEGGGEGWGAPFNVLPPGATDLVAPLMYTTVGLGLHLKTKYFPISQVVVCTSYCLSLTQCTLVSHLNLDLPL